MTHEDENTNSPAVAGIRELVALSSRILGHTDQGDLVWGHASARDPHGRGVWMKASGWGLEEVTPERVQLVSPSGEVLQGTGGRHSEYPIHTEIMAARADVGGVVHTHSPYAVALAAAGQPLLPVSHAATYFVPPEVPRFTDTADLILTSDLGKRVAASLGSASAVFLVNHGIVTAGPTLQVATVAAVLLERAAHQQWITHGFRSWPTWSDAPEALSKRDHIYHPQALDQVWNYLVRRLERLSHPGEAAGGEQVLPAGQFAAEADRERGRDGARQLGAPGPGRTGRHQVPEGLQVQHRRPLPLHTRKVDKAERDGRFAPVRRPAEAGQVAQQQRARQRSRPQAALGGDPQRLGGTPDLPDQDTASTSSATRRAVKWLQRSVLLVLADGVGADVGDAPPAAAGRG